MDTLSAFILGESARASGARPKFYDYREAKKLIDKKASEVAYLFMSGDRGWTEVEVWNKEEGYLVKLNKCPQIAGINHSVWATPMLDIDGEERACFTYDEPMPWKEIAPKRKSKKSSPPPDKSKQ